MKRISACLLLICALVLSSLFFTSCNRGVDTENCAHVDKDNNEKCDICKKTVVVVIDFYALNDLHGKFCDSDGQPGVDELATYLNSKKISDENVVLLSTGDMWQGTAESNLTKGMILTDWMNEMDFVSMTIGNHEYDWGADAIKANAAAAEFPFLAINIYDKSTGERVDYCQPSVLIEREGIQIGIIGAVGDCYGDISAEMVEDVEFKVGSELTELVKAESERLRSLGADLIVYSLHDGSSSGNNTAGVITPSKLSSYYDLSLSDGYVDICFEAHTHRRYVYYDSLKVYHLQGGGDNSGISHAEITVNLVTGKKTVNEAEVIRTSEYSYLSDDPATEAIEKKYSTAVSKANEVLGTVSNTQSSEAIEDIVAELYLEAGLEKWGDKYDIALGGGFIRTRSPYDLSAGRVKYSDVFSILPFDNRLVLCSVSGSKLNSQFINSTNEDYHIALSEYGEDLTVNAAATYYVIVDTYTAFYAPNGLTIVEYYDEDVFARDLLSAEIKQGRFDEGAENGGNNTGTGDNTGSGGTGDNSGSNENTGSGGTGDNSGSNENTGSGDAEVCAHKDIDNNDECDICFESVVIVLDFYAINDLHGKFCDGDNHPGVDELATYLKTMRELDDNFILLSSGDMWQGAAESNLTRGMIITDWMNEMDFVSMTIGNHEYDWGADAILANASAAEFPFLAINIYDTATGKRVDYCQPSVIVERDGIQIGIIGAVGDCYSSISSDMVKGVEFKVGSELTALVKAESERLRALGADVIVYSLHDDYSKYDESLSNGYVDICFEAHTHQGYVNYDLYSVCHIQGGGDNSGISHIEFVYNFANGNKKLNEAEVIKSSVYSQYAADPATEAIEVKYADDIAKATAVLGKVSTYMSDSKVEDTVAGLYLKAGLEKWGSRYNIVLGGGFLKTRSPYNIQAGEVTYGDLLNILPFDNRLVLCSVSGSKLNSQFINSTNANYHIALSKYGEGLNVSSGSTYYVVVDTYTAYYAYNGLTIVDWYDEGVYARDLLADEIRSGAFDDGTSGTVTDVQSSASNPITDISILLNIGSTLEAGEKTETRYYVKGTVKSAPDTYGNFTLADADGNEIKVYGINGYSSLGTKPVKGDTVILCGPVYNYQGTTLELYYVDLIKII